MHDSISIDVVPRSVFDWMKRDRLMWLTKILMDYNSLTSKKKKKIFIYFLLKSFATFTSKSTRMTPRKKLAVI